MVTNREGNMRDIPYNGNSTQTETVTKIALQSPTEHDNHRDVLGLDQVDNTSKIMVKKRPPMVLVWSNVILFFVLHIGASYSFFLIPQATTNTMIWTLCLYFWSTIGITAGAHRLWSHRSYKAKLPLRIFLAMCNCISFQDSIYEWCRDHRAHHKFSETDADPHNAKRGFFFSHIGWLLVKRHPDLEEKEKLIDLSDLKNDPVVAFQDRHYLKLITLFCFIIPTVIPALAWGESLYIAFYISAILRYTLLLNAAFMINSAAHMWGNKPYDERIDPCQNPALSLCTLGEGFHNYHHVFPHDYSTSEFGWKLNMTTMFIDLMALIGQAYDRRTIPKEVIEKRKLRTGDGSE